MNINNLFNNFGGSDLDPEEKAQLESWKQESMENIHMIKELQQIHDADLSDYIVVDKDAAWEAVTSVKKNNPIESESTTPILEASIPVKKPNYLIRIAAVLAIVGACLIGVKYFATDNYIAWEPKTYVSEVSKKEVILDDASKVTVGKESSLEIRSEREVAVDGRVYFDVERNETVPFKVHTPQGEITVLGTEFSVETNESYTQVLVTEGSVKFTNEDREIILKVGDFIHVENGGITKTKKKIGNYLSWKDDRLEFRDTPLTIVLDDIERHYGKRIIIKDSKTSARCHLTSTFEQASFKTVLTELKSVFGLKLTRNGDTIEIVDSNC